ncbi:hypothetical protein L208DRAFT_1380435 [Tricholoma matsutake]|nr:hypothetical protein L208DRAFT_1380435 [Tricholoma matsutake 945]
MSTKCAHRPQNENSRTSHGLLIRHMIEQVNQSWPYFQDLWSKHQYWPGGLGLSQPLFSEYGDWNHYSKPELRGKQSIFNQFYISEMYLEELGSEWTYVDGPYKPREEEQTQGREAGNELETYEPPPFLEEESHPIYGIDIQCEVETNIDMEEEDNDDAFHTSHSTGSDVSLLMGSDSDINESNDSRPSEYIPDNKPDVFSAEAWVTQFQEVSNEWKGDWKECSVQLGKLVLHCHPNHEILSKCLTKT